MRNRKTRQPLILDGKELNPIQKALFTMDSGTLRNTVSASTSLAILGADALFFIAAPFEEGTKFILAMVFSLVATVFAVYLIVTKIFPSIGWNDTDPYQTLKKAAIVNRDTLNQYISVTADTSVLRRSFGDPYFEKKKREEGFFDPTILTTLEKPGLEDLLDIVRKRGKFSEPIRIKGEIEDLSAAEKITLYKAIQGIKANDAFAEKAIKTLGMKRIEEDISELFEFKTETEEDIGVL